MPRHSPDALFDLTISKSSTLALESFFTIVFLSVNSGFSQQIDFEIVTLSLSPSWRQASSRFVVYLSSLGFYILSYATLFSFQGTAISNLFCIDFVTWTLSSATYESMLLRRSFLFLVTAGKYLKCELQLTLLHYVEDVLKSLSRRWVPSLAKLTFWRWWRIRESNP